MVCKTFVYCLGVNFFYSQCFFFVMLCCLFIFLFGNSWVCYVRMVHDDLPLS
uniref:Uncharacterized protein n=1 Tax=Setaria italica TaxID=4555 RepID=K4ANX4_SETIT